MDNLIFYLTTTALVLVFLATTPVIGKKQDETFETVLVTNLAVIF